VAAGLLVTFEAPAVSDLDQAQVALGGSQTGGVPIDEEGLIGHGHEVGRMRLPMGDHPGQPVRRGLVGESSEADQEAA